MTRSISLACVSLLALSAPAFAQDTGGTAEEIIVTATKRAQPLSRVPIAVSALTANQLRETGAVDIRGLNQITPSLLVSSTSSEAVGGVARIRGIGTVGDNPGLESSVATFIDGVYRSRSGTAFTELGDVERIEVLRGPQGTLFGRNASAGLINIVTAKPAFEDQGNAEVTYGNYDYWRLAGGLTGAIDKGHTLAYRLDGVYTVRDGFLKDVISGRRLNGRDRWLARGQLLYQPTTDLSVRLIGDYAKRDEECCGASYLPARNVTGSSTVSPTFSPNTVAALERAFGGTVIDDPFSRRVALNTGRSFRSDVRDWGLSGQIDWNMGDAALTSITAWRDWTSKRGQDADFSSLDLMWRDKYNQRFQTFSQELRLNGTAFGGVLDWLVGGYYAHERLTLTDNLSFGSQFGPFESCLVANGLVGAISPSSAGCITPEAASAAFGPFSTPIVDGLTRLQSTVNVGATGDHYRQNSTNWALFTHNVIDITDRLSLTLGARYTHDRKTLDADIASNTNACAVQRTAMAALRTQIAAAGLAASQAASLTTIANTLQSLSCASNIAGADLIDGHYSDAQSDSQWTGTAVLSFRPIDDLLTYASYSKGYKAGGYNLDRAGLNLSAPSVSSLRFAPEKVDSFEIGAKLDLRSFRLNAAAFYELFDQFQLNTFNGVNFLVENISGCGNALVSGTCTGSSKAGVVSRGFEVEATMLPSPDFVVQTGFTYADTRYRSRITGMDGRVLPAALFLLPGSTLSNAPAYVVTGAASYTPQVSASGIHALFHVDFRFMSDYNSGSDLLYEKRQDAVTTVNARIGLTGPDKRWSLEFWGQNLFNADYFQTVAGAPLQGSGSLATVSAASALTTGTGMFIGFPAEPRTYGLTLRTRF